MRSFFAIGARRFSCRRRNKWRRSRSTETSSAPPSRSTSSARRNRAGSARARAWRSVASRTPEITRRRRSGTYDMKLVDALVGALRDWDVGYVFGVSGANIEHVHDAIHRIGDGKLRSIFAKSEVGAAFMADARARTHRTLGVCCATSGGGMMN